MSKPIHKLFLLDAMALIYRAHFAFSKTPRVTSRGLNTGAIFGFTNTLLEILEKEKPSHIGISFDTSAPTFRHEQFSAYKAHRQEQPEDISVAIPYVKKLADAFDIPLLLLDGFEADDVIGTIAKKAAREGFEVYMMTMDKDYGQLVEENIYLYKPSYLGKGHEVLGVKEILNKWGIENVLQVADLLGLQGDTSDNIPGIPGIGEKTAQKLISEYGSVENLIANADKLSGRIKENVIKFADQGILSKHLATIDINVPIEFVPEKLVYNGGEKKVIIELFEELEFKTIRKRLFGDPDAKAKPSTQSGQLGISFGGEVEVDVTLKENIIIISEDDENKESSKETIETVPHRYHLIDTPELREMLISHLLKQDSFCFDTETDSIDPIEAQLVGIAFCAYEKEAYYVPLLGGFEETKKIVDEFKIVLENDSIIKIGQNLKYDIVVLKKYNVEVSGPLFDTMLANYLIAPEGRHNMDDMAERHLNYTPVSIKDLIGKKGKNQLKMNDVDIEKVKEYAAEDADITLQLKQILEPNLKIKNVDKLFYDLEMPLMPVLAEIEQEGVKIDVNALKEISNILEVDVKQIEEKIYELAGENFNIASPKQLGLILFEKLQLDPKAKKTATGQYATGEDVLSRLSDKHEIVGNILDFRELQKLKSTYIDALPLLISKYDGRVHTSFNQAVTATGRLSSTNPNLQNIPIRTARGREIRKAFVPRNENFLILSADYSQIELRLMASFSKDPTMMEAFKNGLDIHASTASKVFKVSLDEVNSDLRRKAKTVNFGIIYGISAFGLSQRLDIPRSEGSGIIKAYFEEFTKVKEYMDSAIQKAREIGYAETLLGRRRYLPEINSQNQTMRGFAERNAINAPLQGSAADMIKLAMINIHNWLMKEKLQSRMILQVHDELVFDVHRDEIEIVKPKVIELMKNALLIDVPMEVGVGIGDNWLEAH